MKRMLALFVALFALLTACASQHSGTPNRQVAEKITANFGFTGMEELNDCRFFQYMCEKLNITIDYLSYSDSALRLAAMTDTLPDVFPIEINTQMEYELRRLEVIRTIPEAMLAQTPHLQQMVEAFEGSEYLQTDDGLLYLPRYIRSGFQPLFHAIYYRKDWQEEAGIDTPPETTDELYALLRDLAEWKERPVVTGGLWQIHYMPWVDIDNWVLDDDGVWKPGYITQGALAAAKWWNRLYYDGILASEFYAESARTEFTADRTAAYWGSFGLYWGNRVLVDEFERDNPDFAGRSGEAIALLPPLRTPEGQAQWPARQKTYMLAFNHHLSDEKLARILEWLDWYQTDEALGLMSNGFEGVDFGYDENGSPVSLLPALPDGSRPMRIYEQLPGVSSVQLLSFEIGSTEEEVYSAYPTRITALYDFFQTRYTPVVKPYNLFGKMFLTPDYEEFLATTEGGERFMSKLVVNRDPEREFYAARDYLLTQCNLQSIIEEFNLQYAKR